MFQKHGKKALKVDLRNIDKLCKWLDNPQERLNFVHVAGTNGKGSVSHYLSAMLSSQGMKVGLYTSPHYKDFRERIKVDKSFISKACVKEFVGMFQQFIAKEKDFYPSFFELTVAMAFWVFEREKVDIVVLETGLGGRLDSTNIVKPLLSVITNISMDHQWTLGNTLKAIAKEKAGIIKKKTPVLIGEYQEEVIQVFEKKATQLKAPLYLSKSIVKVDKKDTSEFKIKAYKEKLKIDFPVKYQRKNFKTALASMWLLSDKVPTVKVDLPRIKSKFSKELSKWKYLGRMTWISKQPRILIDSAHNEAGLKQFFSYVHDLNYKNLHIITGFVNDKDLSSVLPLFPTEANYYFVAAKIPRALKAQKLCDESRPYELTGKAYKSVRIGLAAAKKSAKKKDLICVVGSIFVVAEVI